MGGPFSQELANAAAGVARLVPAHPEGIYAVPWYLVIGEPGSGRSTAIRSMNLSWPEGTDGQLQVGPQALATYWAAKEALVIEPEPIVLGPGRNQQFLTMLCDELKRMRPREPMDGVILVVSLAAIIDLDERGLERYAGALRRYMVEIGKVLGADVPIYAIITHYDTMWGFAEVFQWTPDRKGEEAWGFVLPGDVPSQQAAGKINEELDGLHARFEAFCLAKLGSEDPPEHRSRAFQHLVEVRHMMTKIKAFFGSFAMANAYERAPWMRALIVGSAVPGTGDRPRAGIARFANMGLNLLHDPPRSGRPGGLPLFGYMKSVVLPEKDLVPTRTRWRDDTFFVIGAILVALAWVGFVVTAIVLSQQ